MNAAIYSILNTSCTIGSKPWICDSGVFIARFKPDEDEFRTEAEYLLEMLQFDFLAPISALVEAFHGCRKDARELLSWVVSPSNVTLLPEDTNLTGQARQIHSRMRELDLVDCLILVYAENVAKACGLNRPLPICSVDERMMGQAKYLNADFTFLNLRHPDTPIQ